jgi:hypothetical protein
LGTLGAEAVGTGIEALLTQRLAIDRARGASALGELLGERNDLGAGEGGELELFGRSGGGHGGRNVHRVRAVRYWSKPINL